MSVSSFFFRLSVSVLLSWPPIHAALSRANHFSPWRFAGWGMYSTPYPSEKQLPLVVVAVQSEGGTLYRIPVLIGEANKSDYLREQLGIAFCAQARASAEPLALPADAVEQLENLARAVRQMDRSRNVHRLRLWLEGEISGTKNWDFWVVVARRRADVSSNRYGTEIDYVSPGRRSGDLPINSADPPMPERTFSHLWNCT